MNTLQTFSANPEVLRLGWTLLHFLWQGALASIVLVILLLALRSYAASVRYIIACITLLVMAIMPVATYVALGVPVDEDASPMKAQPAKPQTSPIVAQPDTSNSTAAKSAVTEQMTTVDWTMMMRNFLRPILPAMVLVWFLGFIAMMLRLFGGLLHAERLKRRRVQPLGEDWSAILSSISQRLGITATVRLLESALVESPVVLGYFKPVILVPISALTGLSREQLEAVLAHELAHVGRGDYWMLLVQHVIEAVLFYHPAVWWVSRQISIEREHCCDDLAARACGGAYNYAQALTELARLNVATPSYALPLHGGSLLARIRRLLNATETPHRQTTWWPGGVFAMLITCCLLLVTVRVGLAATTDSQPAIAPAAPVAATAIANEPSAQSQTPPTAPGVTGSTSAAAATPVATTPGIALLDFSRVGTDTALGEASVQMIELVGEQLSNAGSLRLVDRAVLDRTLGELKLGASGLADPATAGKVGSLIGARYFVSARLMKTGDDWLCTVKLIDTETSEISGLRVNGKPSEGVAPFSDHVAQAIVERLAGLPSGAANSAANDSADVATLRKELEGRKLPTVAVAIPESHLGDWVPDPAGENEIISVLINAGYQVVDIKSLLEHEQPSVWASLFFGRREGDAAGAIAGVEAGGRNPADLFKNKEIAKIRAKADVFVVGEAFSESAGEQSGFESCTSRVEAKAIDTKSEKVLWASSQHAVAADISEHIAGKKALRNGGHTIGLDLARNLAGKWQAAPTQPDSGTAK